MVFLLQNAPKSVFRLGSAPDPAGDLTTLSRPPSRMGTPLPVPIPRRHLRRLGPGVSLLNSSAITDGEQRRRRQRQQQQLLLLLLLLLLLPMPLCYYTVITNIKRTEAVLFSR